MNKKNLKALILLHVILFVYSLGGIASKFAAKQRFLSLKFLFFYGVVLLVLVVYAIAWQQILKKISLITAYSNKAITVIWGIVWGAIIFHESISINKIAGSLFIVLGVYLMVSEKDEMTE